VSQQNVAIVRRALAHRRASGDFLEEIIAPDFVWDMSKFRGWPEQQTYQGIDGARRFVRDWTAAFDEWEVDLEEVHDAGGNKVVGILRQRGRSKSTGVPVDMLLAAVYTLRDGQQTRAELYSDPAEALKAVGLQE
jgi:ketosteroid isomerase-like protein